LYILDTNIVSNLVRGDDMGVRKRFLAVSVSQCRISAITEAEIRHGLARRNWPSRLSAQAARFLSSVEILPWTSREAEAYAELRLAMTRSGTSLSEFDSLIAAQAMASKAVLATTDRAFANIHGLAVEDWTA
jgi:tRNA(fMet)-specific endonuclease VapC